MAIRRRNAIRAFHVFRLQLPIAPAAFANDGLDAGHAPTGIALVQERPGAGLLDAWGVQPGWRVTPAVE
jgi:hypothetical protein